MRAGGADGEGKDGEGGGGGEEAAAANLAVFFPSFTWVLRDFSLDLVDESGFSITPTEYMNSCLAQKPGWDE
jgi:hypothetical protein